MKSYHFSVGNSFPGPVGFCAQVEAESPEEAVEILKDELAGFEAYDLDCGIGHLCIMLNADAISVDDIEEVEAAD